MNPIDMPRFAGVVALVYLFLGKKACALGGGAYGVGVGSFHPHSLFAMSSHIQNLRQSAAETSRIAESIMRNPRATEQEFSEAFRARDIAFVQSQAMEAEQAAEMRWETQCGCNGDDSPYHTYFGMNS